MKTNLTLLLTLITLPMTSLGQDYPTRVKSAYELSDKLYDLDCSYVRSQDFKLITPTSKTVRSVNQLSRDFIIETERESVPMNFKVIRTGAGITYSAMIKNSEARGALKARQFALAPVADANIARSLETAKINCAVVLAEAEPVDLKNSSYHFNIHPHTIYDWQKKLKAPIEAYLNNPKFESMIFLETDDGRGNRIDLATFLDGKDQKLPESPLSSDLQNVPLTTPLVVSPSGNNRFTISADSEINITFSGGNHNYCIWNSTRQVLMGLMKSKSEARVNFIYDTKAIVAQQRGMEGLVINFSKKAIAKSNLLFDLLSDKGVQNGYHFSYLIFFRNLFAQEYAGMYKTFKVTYTAPGYNETFTMNGTGTRDLEVFFDYL